MIYLAFAFNVLVLGAFILELRGARKERQSLALLIKSESVQEFVRAEAQLAAPSKPEEAPKDDAVDFDDASPEEAIAGLQGRPPTT